MIVECSQCLTKFKIADEKITERGVKVRCSKCKHLFVVSKNGEIKEEPSPESGSASMDPFAGGPTEKVSLTDAAGGADPFLAPTKDVSGAPLPSPAGSAPAASPFSGLPSLDDVFAKPAGPSSASSDGNFPVPPPAPMPSPMGGNSLANHVDLDGDDEFAPPAGADSFQASPPKASTGGPRKVPKVPALPAMPPPPGAASPGLSPLPSTGAGLDPTPGNQPSGEPETESLEIDKDLADDLFGNLELEPAPSPPTPPVEAPASEPPPASIPTLQEQAASVPVPAPQSANETANAAVILPGSESDEDDPFADIDINLKDESPALGQPPPTTEPSNCPSTSIGLMGLPQSWAVTIRKSFT